MSTRAVGIFLLLAAVPGFAQQQEDDGAPRARKDGPVFVHLDADKPKVELIRILGSSVGTGYVSGKQATIHTTYLGRVCQAPCDEWVDADYRAVYYIGGEGVTPSESFDLTGRRPATRINVKAGSAGRRLGGWVATTSGLGGIVLGGTLLGVNALTGVSAPPHPANPNGGSGPGATLNTISWIGVGAGVALLATGIWMIGTSGTHLTFEDAPAPDDTPEKPRNNVFEVMNTQPATAGVLR